jgi:hypothetical protein
MECPIRGLLAGLIDSEAMEILVDGGVISLAHQGTKAHQEYLFHSTKPAFCWANGPKPKPSARSSRLDAASAPDPLYDYWNVRRTRHAVPVDNPEEQSHPSPSEPKPELAWRVYRGPHPHSYYNMAAWLDDIYGEFYSLVPSQPSPPPPSFGYNNSTDPPLPLPRAPLPQASPHAPLQPPPRPLPRSPPRSFPQEPPQPTPRSSPRVPLMESGLPRHTPEMPVTTCKSQPNNRALYYEDVHFPSSGGARPKYRKRQHNQATKDTRHPPESINDSGHRTSSAPFPSQDSSENLALKFDQMGDAESSPPRIVPRRRRSLHDLARGLVPSHEAGMSRSLASGLDTTSPSALEISSPSSGSNDSVRVDLKRASSLTESCQQL